MKKAPSSKTSIRKLLPQLDPTDMLIPLFVVVAAYSYRRLAEVEEPHHAVRIFWAFIFIIFPIGLINAQSSLSSLQSVSIVAAFPIGIVIVLLVASFLKDAGQYLRGAKDPPPGGRKD